MSQRDRDRLVVLKKAQKKLITQKQAAAELGLGERQVRRLLVKLKEAGDRAAIHGLRGRPSNRRLSEKSRQQAVRILSQACTGASARRWPASIWPTNTSCTSGGKRCGRS